MAKARVGVSLLRFSALFPKSSSWERIEAIILFTCPAPFSTALFATFPMVYMVAQF
jgi:hypothetical protein